MTSAAALLLRPSSQQQQQQQQCKAGSQWAHLSPDILELVVAHLPGPCEIRQVCTAWRASVDLHAPTLRPHDITPSLPTSCLESCSTLMPTAPNAPLARRLAWSFPSASRADLSRCGGRVADADVAALAAGCARLAHVSLAGCPALTAAGIAALLAATPVVSADPGLGFGGGGGGSRLRSLDLSHCPGVAERGDATLCMLGRPGTLPHLTHLSLAGWQPLGGAGLEALAGGGSSGGGGGSGDCGGNGRNRRVQGLPPPPLRELDLGECQGLADGDLRPLGRITTLCALRLRNCRQLTGGALRVLAECLPHLTLLDIGGVRVGCEEWALEPLGALQGVRDLRLAGCRQLTDAALAAWAPRAPPLMTRLDLSGCCAVGNAGVRPVMTFLGHTLQRLNLAGTAITADALVFCGSGSSSPCSSPSNSSRSSSPSHGSMKTPMSSTAAGAGARAAAVGPPPLGTWALPPPFPLVSPVEHRQQPCWQHQEQQYAAITSLDLSGCGQVTDAGLRAALPRLPRLARLHLSACSGLRDGADWAAAAPAGLAVLRMRGCSGPAIAGALRAVEAAAARQAAAAHAALDVGGTTAAALIASAAATAVAAMQQQPLPPLPLQALQELDVSLPVGALPARDLAPLRLLRGLRRVRLAYTDADDATLCALGALPALEAVSLAHCHAVSAAAVARWLAGRRVWWLDVAGCPRVDGAGLPGGLRAAVGRARAAKLDRCRQ